MASDRIQVPFSFSYPTSVFVSTSSTTFSSGTSEAITVMSPAVSAPITIINRDTNNPATIWQTESGASFFTSVTTDASGNVPGWLDAGSYKITAAPVGSFAGATINFDPSRGDGTTLIAPGAVTVNALATNVAQAQVQVGTVHNFAGGAAPSGYLLCDGSVYATGLYPLLASIIGTTYNIGGEGVGNFRVPNLSGRVSVGSGPGAGLTNRPLASAGGEETHTLSESEMAPHSHGGVTVTETAQHDHTVAGTTATENAQHNHSIPGNILGGNPPSNLSTSSANFGAHVIAGTVVTGVENQVHAHDFSGTTSAENVPHAHDINSDGGGSSHNNMQPFLALTAIIKHD
jgi:microcystin-dependent protein